MAQNVKWILDYEKQFGNDKIMIWAHNAHVTKKMFDYTSIGENLKKIFNDKFYALGFDFYEGSFTANPSDNKSNLLSQKLAIFNGDSFIKNHNRNIYLVAIVSILIFILAISAFIYRKIKRKKL